MSSLQRSGLPFRCLYWVVVVGAIMFIVRPVGAQCPPAGSGAAGQTSGGTSTGVLFSPPITVVFSNLPPDVQLVNPTGFTASGRPFIQINDALPRDFPVMRVQIQIRNDNLDAPTTFFTPFPVRVFAGAFDPSLL